MTSSAIKIKIASSISRPFKIATGLRQNDALSPILLNLVLEIVVRAINIPEGLILG